MFSDKHISATSSSLVKSVRAAFIGLGLLTAVASPVPVVAEAGQPAAAQASTGYLNINTADADEIADVLSGVGLKKAQAIVDYRAQHGPFQSLEELLNVKGIGTGILAKNQQAIALQ